MKIGIDAGGTLIKIAILENDIFTYKKKNLQISNALQHGSTLCQMHK